MSLPTIKNSTFNIKVKELLKPIKIRRMVVAEHKAIQQATDLGSETDIVLTIAEVTKACTDNIINETSVPQYLLDYIFLQIYINSVENIINSKYTCYGLLKNEETNELLYDEETGDTIRCNQSFDVKIPLTAATILYPENFDSIKSISITDEIKLNLKCLSLQDNINIKEIQQEIFALAEEIENIKHSKEEESDKEIKIKELTNKILLKKKNITNDYFYYSIETVEDNGSLLTPNIDFNKEEFLSWIDNCPSNAISNIEKFYESIPQLGFDLDIVCPSCGNQHQTKLRGLQDFFS